MKLYEYLYYRIYDWDLKRWGLNHRPEGRALFGVSTLMTANILTIVLIFQSLGIINYFNSDYSKDGSLINIISMIIIWTANYFWLVKNGKYKKIAEKYQNEPKNKRLQNTILLWLYGIMSVGIPLLMATLQ